MKYRFILGGMIFQLMRYNEFYQIKKNEENKK